MLAALERAAGSLQYRALTQLLRRMAGLRARTVEVGGLTLPVLRREGPGVPLVLLHGFGADKEGWLLLAARLGRKRPLIIPDLPGFGAAPAIAPGQATARRQAAVVAGLLDQLRVPRAHLAGSSMGGGISLRLAADAPARVASLTLIGSVGPVVDKSELQLALDRGENPLVIQSSADFDAFMRLVLERRPPSTRAILRHLAHERAGRSAALTTLFGGWTSGDGPPDELEAIRAPALVVHGDCDRVVHVSTARALASRLPRARLELLRGVGHAPATETPRRVASLLQEFLREVER